MQKKEDSRIKKWFNSLKEKYHLTLINKDSFAEIYSRQVSKGRFFLLAISISFGFFVLAFCVISFTPIKKLVPGFESDEMQQELIKMKQQIFAMEQEIAGKLNYANQLDSIFNVVDDLPDSGNKITPLQDLSLIKNSTKSEQISLFNYHFYQPITGIVSQKFNVKEKHYGIDIVSEKNETIKSVLSGKVILASWTLEQGNIIAVQHQDNLVSFYKHNSVLLKHSGDLVKAGEIIAIVGNSGEQSSGPHLHFELWQNGTPLNPLDLMSFE